MQLVSFGFLIFLPVVAGINYLIPRKYRYIWLLFTSIAFYISIDYKLAFVMVLSILSTYFAGLMLGDTLEAKDNSRATAIFALCIIFNLGLLIGFKGAGILTNGSIAAPVGISFYLLKAVSYLVDVKRGDIKAEKNLAMYALYVSFFTQVVSGPIERAGNMLSQFYFPVSVDYYRLRDGFLQMLWGYFLKLVLADRMAIFVKSVYGNPQPGTITFIGTLLYTFEIYCDFGGYSHIAIGAARILGIDVMKNFDSPYLSCSVAEFWRRWHISLSSWLRDYVYIPLGGNRKGTARKYINILIVFAVSGIWHGMGITFMVWGLLHGLYQVLGYILKPVRDSFVKAFSIKRESFSHKLVKIAITFLLVNFAWIFFRAESLSQAFDIAVRSFRVTPWALTDGSLFAQGLDGANMFLLFVGILVMIAVDIANYRGYVLREKILSLGLLLRWVIIISAILVVLLCGIWGPGYDAASFIYQQF